MNDEERRVEFAHACARWAFQPPGHFSKKRLTWSEYLQVFDGELRSQFR